MRFVSIILLLAVAAHNANASEALVAKDRIALSETLDRSCQATQYVQIMKDAAAGGQAVAPEFLDARTIPLDKLRAGMKSDPDTARVDRRIVSACGCILSKWQQRVKASRTADDFHAISVDWAADGKKPATQAHYNACVTKARDVP